VAVLRDLADEVYRKALRTLSKGIGVTVVVR
jgi:hypothetical protein